MVCERYLQGTPSPLFPTTCPGSVVGVLSSATQQWRRDYGGSNTNGGGGLQPGRWLPPLGTEQEESGRVLASPGIGAALSSSAPLL